MLFIIFVAFTQKYAANRPFSCFDSRAAAKAANRPLQSEIHKLFKPPSIDNHNGAWYTSFSTRKEGVLNCCKRSARWN